MKTTSLAIALGLAISSQAHAAGFYFSDIGVRAYSRGGAFVAGADDLTAMYYNPAALTRLERPQIMINVAGVQQFVDYQRLQEPGRGNFVDYSDIIGQLGAGQGMPEEDSYFEDATFPAIKNKSPAFVIPHFGFSSKFGTPNTTFAFGFYPPYAPDLSYDKDGPQRYSLIDTMVIQTSLGPSVAHRFNDWISVGVGVAWSVLMAEQSLTISVPWLKDYNNPFNDGKLELNNNTPPNEDTSNDVGFRFDAADWGGISWNAGIMIEPPNKRWAFGLMVQPPVKFSADGTMEADFSGHTLATEDAYSPIVPTRVILSETVTDKDVTLNITMPLILKTGFAFRPTETSEIEFATVWQNWSSIQNLVITGLDMVVDVDNELGIGDDKLEDTLIDDDVVMPTYYQDAWSFRLGGQNHFGKFTVRAGTFYETSAVPKSTINVSRLDANKIGYGLGGSYRPNTHWSIDVGLSQIFFEDVTVKNSEIEQIAVEPITGDFVEGTIVGNGTYKSSGLIFGAGLNYYFGG